MVHKFCIDLAGSHKNREGKLSEKQSFTTNLKYRDRKNKAFKLQMKIE